MNNTPTKTDLELATDHLRDALLIEFPLSKELNDTTAKVAELVYKLDEIKRKHENAVTDRQIAEERIRVLLAPGNYAGDVEEQVKSLVRFTEERKANG